MPREGMSCEQVMDIIDVVGSVWVPVELYQRSRRGGDVIAVYSEVVRGAISFLECTID